MNRLPRPDSPQSQSGADAAVWPVVAVAEVPGVAGYGDRGYGELGAVGEVEGECAKRGDRVAVAVTFDRVVAIDGDACDRREMRAFPPECGSGGRGSGRHERPA